MNPEHGTVVLAMDDDPTVLELLHEHLADAGDHVLDVTRGEEGWHKAWLSLPKIHPAFTSRSILIPKSANSLWMRGEPHIPLSRLIRRISTWVFPGMGGRPGCVCPRRHAKSG